MDADVDVLPYEADFADAATANGALHDCNTRHSLPLAAIKRQIKSAGCLLATDICIGELSFRAVNINNYEVR